MSGVDFLTRLVERTLGSAPTVRPLVPPLYADRPGSLESASVEERWEDRPATARPSLEAAADLAPAAERPHDQTHRKRSVTAHQRRRESEAATPRRDRLASRAQVPEPSAPAKPASSASSPARPPGAPPRPLQAAPPPAEVSPIARATVRVEGRPPAAAPPPAPRSEPPALPLEPLAVRRRDAVEPARRADDKEPTEPTIRVTIGRVEVRAVSKPAPPPPPARPRPEQTLAEYLRESTARRQR